MTVIGLLSDGFAVRGTRNASGGSHAQRGEAERRAGAGGSAARGTRKASFSRAVAAA
jgi:hypothetical protein